MVAKRDYYDVLGVGRNAGEDDLKRAYRRLARQYHPDVSKTDGTEERFKEINEAYQVLSDPDKRAAYDRFGHAAVDGSAGMGGFEGFPFGDIFDVFFGTSRSSARTGPERGGDLRYHLNLTFEEAVFGCEKELQVPRLETCPRCDGARAEPGTTPQRCPVCHGSGQVRRSQQSIFGQFVTAAACERCSGEGTIVDAPCTECRGRGQVQVARRVAVTIPAGVDEGTQIRLAGQGEGGLRGGPAGNLYVAVSVKPHKFFKRDGLDIIYNLDIDIGQAGLGDEVPVPTADGKGLRITIPAGSQFGDTIVLKERGVPDLRSGRKGNQIVRLRVTVPRNLTDDQKRLLHEFETSLGKNVSPQDEKGLRDRIKDALGV